MIMQNVTASPAPIAPPSVSIPVDPRGPVATVRAVGVGIDTARYGHYAAFLRDDLQPAAKELAFAESADGYGQLRARLEAIIAKGAPVHFHVRVDAAGQYADNLLHYLRNLANPAHPDALCGASFSISCGDPNCNKNYRAAFFGNQKSDPVEARAAARFAINERPRPMTQLPDELRQLRQIASRLHAVVRQRTRLINQFHLLLVHAFPELAAFVNNIAVGWVLELINRYPTARLLAAANDNDLADIPYLPHDNIPKLLELARCSVASLAGDLEEELIRDQIRQIRDVNARQNRLENLLIQAYRRLPQTNHLNTIKGFGEVTAAILTAVIRDINRFDTPNSLVKYFGTHPIEASSGAERDGSPRGPKRYVMSKCGNDLVRAYLWMAALSAISHNPAVKPLYQRVVAKHPEERAIAVGHAMRKLLHLVFAVWKSGKPFDPKHYAWDKPAHLPGSTRPPATASTGPTTKQNQAAGHTESALPTEKVVTAARADILPQATLPTAPAAGFLPVENDAFLDFADIKRRLPMSRVLDHLGLTPALRGSGAQRRCACPIHRGDGRARTFSVNLDKDVFSCHKCKANGDVIDLWAALHKQSLRAAALDLVRTFGLIPSAPC